MNIATDDGCKEAFNKLKFDKNCRYIVFKIQDEVLVWFAFIQIVERVGEKAETWESFIPTLPDDEFRFAVFDLEYTNADNMSVSRLVFVNWNPDSAPIKGKGRVLYATSRENFRSYLDLLTKDITLTSKNDVQYPLTIDDRARINKGIRKMILHT